MPLKVYHRFCNFLIKAQSKQSQTVNTIFLKAIFLRSPRFKFVTRLSPPAHLLYAAARATTVHQLLCEFDTTAALSGRFVPVCCVPSGKGQVTLVYKRRKLGGDGAPSVGSTVGAVRYGDKFFTSFSAQCLYHRHYSACVCSTK